MARLSKRNLLVLSKVCASAGTGILLVGIGLGWSQQQDNQNVHTQPRIASARTEPAPSTEKSSDDDFKNHRVPPDAPRYIFIPKISVRAMIKPVGLTAANQIASPRNIFDVGWYTGSAKPGQPGAIVLDGHVSSWEARGVFHGLKNLQIGDTLTVERGDGTTLTYRVAKNQTYDADKVDMPAALTPVNPDKPGLNLISCTGKVIKGTNEFDKRIVVFAEQL